MKDSQRKECGFVKNFCYSFDRPSTRSFEVQWLGKNLKDHHLQDIEIVGIIAFN